MKRVWKLTATFGLEYLVLAENMRDAVAQLDGRGHDGLVNPVEVIRAEVLETPLLREDRLHPEET